MVTEGDRKTLTVLEAARMLGLSKNLMYDACRSGVIPSRVVGRRRILSVAAIEAWLAGVAPEGK